MALRAAQRGRFASDFVQALARQASRGMNLTVLKSIRGNPWIACMLVIDIVIAGILTYNKLTAHFPNPEYMHLLVTYHFGFLKRALIGVIVSLFADKVPISLVYSIGLTVWLVTVILYVVLFFRSFGLHKDRMLLFAFVVGSPFFFKNFLFSVGYFDIYGCAFAIVVLLIPLNAAYPLIVVVGCLALLLIHHLHLFIYIPTIWFIFLIRYFMLSPITPLKSVVGVSAAVLLLAAFLAVLSANSPIPPETLLNYMKSRALDPFDAGLLGIWYSNVADEMKRTWAVIPSYALRAPVYLGLIVLHFPLIRFFKQIVSALAGRGDKVFVMAGLCAITAAYPVMWIIVHDHARHISNWAVCMLLSMHAVMMLPPRRQAALAECDSRVTRLCAWAVTCIPRVGIVVPF